MDRSLCRRLFSHPNIPNQAPAGIEAVRFCRGLPPPPHVDIYPLSCVYNHRDLLPDCPFLREVYTDLRPLLLAPQARRSPVPEPGKMKETIQPPPRRNWFQRLFSLLKLPRNAPGTAAIPIGTSRVPSKVLLSAKRALQWISIVPGGTRAMANIDVALETVNGFNVVSAPSTLPAYFMTRISGLTLRQSLSFILWPPQTCTQDEGVRRHLEYHVQCLIELLEPFSIMRRHDVSPALQSQVLKLGR